MISWSYASSGQGARPDGGSIIYRIIADAVNATTVFMGIIQNHCKAEDRPSITVEDQWRLAEMERLCNGQTRDDRPLKLKDGFWMESIWMVSLYAPRFDGFVKYPRSRRANSKERGVLLVRRNDEECRATQILGLLQSRRYLYCRMARSRSRCSSRRRMVWRLSCLFLPRARAIWILALPFLK